MNLTDDKTLDINEDDTTEEVMQKMMFQLAGGVPKNMAGLVAIMKGDFDNAKVARTEGGIEAQEAAGQQTFVTSSTLPLRMNGDGTREDLEAMGIRFLDDADDLFVNVELPAGWEKRATEHSMHNELMDDKGRKRAGIFYKAAYYDRSAHIHLVKRYGYRTGVLNTHNDWSKEETEPHVARVYDGNDIIWTSEHQIAPRPKYDRENPHLQEQWYEEEKALRQMGKDWVDENYPGWDSYIAYWD